MGFDFAVKYCPGRLNSTVDALSRHDRESSSDDDATLHAISGPSFALPDNIRAATATDEEAARILHRLQEAAPDAPWRTDAGLLHGKRIFMPDQRDL